MFDTYLFTCDNFEFCMNDRPVVEVARTHSNILSSEAVLQHNNGRRHSHAARFRNARLHSLGHLHDPLQAQVNLHQGA